MSKNHRHLKGNQAGFTLIETIVTIAIFTAVLGAMFIFVMTIYQTYGYTWEQSLAIDEARRGIEITTREIREARTGDDGSYPLEKAEDKQVIFYSDIDNDGKTEKVRYFLGTINNGNLSQECQTASRGGTCSVTFSNFYNGTLKSASVKVSVDGDLDASDEYVAISADGTDLGDLCLTSCLHCAATWQGPEVFDITSQAIDNSIQFIADASYNVHRQCPVASPNHAMKARFELSWTEEIIGAGNEFKKGVIEPVGLPVEYPDDQEQISFISPYVRNAPPIFEYFDSQGNKIIDYPARLSDTKLMKVYLVINVDPNRPPGEFGLESSVELRNLKEE